MCSQSSVTRLDDFYKFLGKNCLTKVTQIFRCLFGLYLIMSPLCKKRVATFLGIFGGELGNFLFHHLVTLSQSQSLSLSLSLFIGTHFLSGIGLLCFSLSSTLHIPSLGNFVSHTLSRLGLVLLLYLKIALNYSSTM